MASPPPPEEPATEKADEKKAAASSGEKPKNESSTDSSNNTLSAAAKLKRDNFLRRLEQQQQQQQLKSPPGDAAPEEKDTKKAGNESKVAGNGGLVLAVKNSEGKKEPPEKDRTSRVNNKMESSINNAASMKELKSDPTLSVGDQLLVGYLSKYCDSSSSASLKSSPSDWIQDVDPSSLSFLKGLAGIKDPNNTSTTIPVNDGFNNPALTLIGRLKSDSTLSSNTQPISRCNSTDIPSRSNSKEGSSNNSNNVTSTNTDMTEPSKMWEVFVPEHAVAGQAFALRANGVNVRVVCPKNASAGQKIRFYLPNSLFETPVPAEEQPPLPPSAPTQQEEEEHNIKTNNLIAQEHQEWLRKNNFQLALENSEAPAAAKKPEDDKPKEDQDTRPAGNPKEDGDGDASLKRSATDASRKPEDGNKPPPQKQSESATTNNSSSSPGSDSGANNSTGDMSLQHRMLNIIEAQQTQMHEMQARLDALGCMMAHIEQDVRSMRYQGEPHRMHPGHRSPTRGAPAGGYRILGGFFGGGAGVPPVVPQPGFGPPSWQQQPLPGVGQQQPGVPVPPAVGQQPPLPAAEPSEQDANIPEAASARPRDKRDKKARAQPAQPPQQQQQQPGQPQAVPAPPGAPGPGGNPAPPPPRHEQVIIINQGIFFPLFLVIFRFVFSIPRHIHALLLHTGLGRVYAHLRDRAIERNAFANVDLSSIMKLLVMLLIFTGRVGEGENRRERNRRNVQNVQGGGLMAYAHSLLQSMYEYWNGHRVHTLILASLIGFLIQVGLMGFLYEVLWVERGELGRAWLGLNNDGAQEDGDEDGEAGGDADSQAAVNGDAANNGDIGNNFNGVPPAAAGGMIRRGPNNGGFFHDVQCLIMSFLLSLIPAWRPEEAAEPLPDPEPEQPQVQEQQQQEGEEQPQQQGDEDGVPQLEPVPAGGDGDAE